MILCKETSSKHVLSANVSRAMRGADQWNRFLPALPRSAVLHVTAQQLYCKQQQVYKRYIDLSCRRVLTLLFRWAWAVTEQNDRAEYWTERHTVQWWRLRERGNLNTAGRCGAAYIFGGRKFSASLVNGQNDSSRHIICLEDFLFSSYSRNRFSPNYLLSSFLLPIHKSCISHMVRIVPVL